MAKIGGFYIAGRELYDDKYISGVVYQLSSIVPFDYKISSPDGFWEIETKRNSAYIIARTTKFTSYDDLISKSYWHAQKTLDILAVRNNYFAVTVNTSKQLIAVYPDAADRVLLWHSKLDYSIGVELKVSSTDKNGITTDLSLKRDQDWYPFLRYYRLSQTSSDLFDAYRNLYLGFEALLDKLYRKKTDEMEIDWLNRSLTELKKRVNPDNDPNKILIDIERIKSFHYDIRCKLLHAKNFNSTIPHDDLNPEDVVESYKELISLYRGIAFATSLISNSGGGIITSIGFEELMSKCFANSPIMQYSPDPSPVSESDTLLSSGSCPTYAFQTTSYDGVITPGTIRLRSDDLLSKSVGNFSTPIFKVGSFMNKGQDLFALNFIEEGIDIAGVDVFRFILDVKLVNRSLPKTSF